MGNYFTYGVFSSEQDFSKAFSALSDRGFDNIAVVKNTDSALYKSASVKNSIKNTFVLGGLAGAVIGGIAGAIATPTVPYGGTYQVLTPMMSMVSGAIVMAYFSVWICGFLRWIDRPLPADCFEGTITNGSLLLVVETDQADLRQLAFDCFSRNNASEIIARSEAITTLELSKPADVSTRPAVVQLAA
ncbi:MAG TPA: hypothetical protein V6C81_08295 [Planktothrix sp.]|jgi:hypothetical protein